MQVGKVTLVFDDTYHKASESVVRLSVPEDETRHVAIGNITQPGLDERDLKSKETRDANSGSANEPPKAIVVTTASHSMQRLCKVKDRAHKRSKDIKEHPYKGEEPLPALVPKKSVAKAKNDNKVRQNHKSAMPCHSRGLQDALISERHVSKVKRRDGAKCTIEDKYKHLEGVDSIGDNFGREKAKVEEARHVHAGKSKEGQGIDDAAIYIGDISTIVAQKDEEAAEARQDTNCCTDQLGGVVDDGTLSTRNRNGEAMLHLAFRLSRLPCQLMMAVHIVTA